MQSCWLLTSLILKYFFLKIQKKNIWSSARTIQGLFAFIWMHMTCWIEFKHGKLELKMFEKVQKISCCTYTLYANPYCPGMRSHRQGRSQPHSPGWARVPLSSFFPQIWINFSYSSSNFTYFLPHFGPPGGQVAHPGRPWLRHWSQDREGGFNVKQYLVFLCLSYFCSLHLVGEVLGTHATGDQIQM